MRQKLKEKVRKPQEVPVNKLTGVDNQRKSKNFLRENKKSRLTKDLLNEGRRIGQLKKDIEKKRENG